MTAPIERGAEALMAPVHAPMNTHSGYDGSCVSCPWPLHEAETPEGIARAVFKSIDVEAITDLLVSHTRISSEKCLCGWGELGRSHARHIATAIKAYLLDGGA